MGHLLQVPDIPLAGKPLGLIGQMPDKAVKQDTLTDDILIHGTVDHINFLIAQSYFSFQFSLRITSSGFVVIML